MPANNPSCHATREVPRQTSPGDGKYYGHGNDAFRVECGTTGEIQKTSKAKRTVLPTTGHDGPEGE